MPELDNAAALEDKEPDVSPPPLPKPVTMKVVAQRDDLNDNETLSGEYMTRQLALLLAKFPKPPVVEEGQAQTSSGVLNLLSNLSLPRIRSGSVDLDPTVQNHVYFSFPAGGFEGDKIECTATPESADEIGASYRVTNRVCGKDDDGIIARFRVSRPNSPKLPGLGEVEEYAIEPPDDCFIIKPYHGVITVWHELSKKSLDGVRIYSKRIDRGANPNLAELDLAYLVNAGDWYILRVPDVRSEITSVTSTLGTGFSSRKVRVVYFADGEPFALYDITTVRMRREAPEVEGERPVSFAVDSNGRTKKELAQATS